MILPGSHLGIAGALVLFTLLTYLAGSVWHMPWRTRGTNLFDALLHAILLGLINDGRLSIHGEQFSDTSAFFGSSH